MESSVRKRMLEHNLAKIRVEGSDILGSDLPRWLRAAESRGFCRLWNRRDWLKAMMNFQTDRLACWLQGLQAGRDCEFGSIYANGGISPSKPAWLRFKRSPSASHLVRWLSRAFGKAELLRLDERSKVNTKTEDTMPLLTLLRFGSGAAAADRVQGRERGRRRAARPQ
jgi:hypothetical protein